ncbi:MAG: hypothetical protein H0W84_09945 [Bacteroidetes bacterium]|nr:hypothetical protein [Bacteroidota bacterium]
MRYTNQFEDDEENTNDETSADSAYVFEGFSIELNEKIMLTPVQTK